MRYSYVVASFGCFFFFGSRARAFGTIRDTQCNIRKSCFQPSTKPYCQNTHHRHLDQNKSKRFNRVISMRGGAIPSIPAMTAVVVSTDFLRGCTVFAAIAILSGYHVNLLRRERAGTPTWRSTQATTREQWSRYVRENQLWLYAIQTLRNAITANTFLATTVLSVLTVISGKLWEMVRQPGTIGRQRLIIQFTCVAVCMLTSAYQFLQGARLMTHAGFMFPVATGTNVDAIMRKSEIAQWLGLRWLYVSLGMIIWTVGGERAFLLSSLALFQFFKSIDRVPEGSLTDSVNSLPTGVSSSLSSSGPSVSPSAVSKGSPGGGTSAKGGWNN
jgi:hypothetical protein